ncbi:unnamed protein product, partial [marine sediment metagenome]
EVDESTSGSEDPEDPEDPEDTEDPTTPQNEPPTAKANGPYSGMANAPVSFSSSGTKDSDGSIASYRWNFGDGETSTSSNPSHVFDATGSYTITITVKDNEGASDVDSTHAFISAPAPPSNQPPVADCNGPYSAVMLNSIQFSSAGSSDPDGSIASYKWNFGDWGTSDKANPTHTYPVPGAYDVKLTVTDNMGLSASSTTQTVITFTDDSGDSDNGDTDPPEEPTNDVPIADCNGPYTGTTGTSVSFSSTGSHDPDGSIVSYKWDFDDGGTSTS